MAELYLVRHAQAAFGTDDYDRLTPLGHQQSRWLGEYFADRNIQFDRVLTGSLRRHRETLAGIAERVAGVSAPEVRPGLDEYDAERMLVAWGVQQRLPPVSAGSDRRVHFQRLREALGAWSDATLAPEGHRSFAEFTEDARSALAAVQSGQAERVLIVSSGGPIAAMIGNVLGMGARAVVNVNLQLRNSGVSELRFNPRSMHCVCFNNIPHLDRAGRRDAITYS